MKYVPFLLEVRSLLVGQNTMMTHTVDDCWPRRQSNSRNRLSTLGWRGERSVGEVNETQNRGGNIKNQRQIQTLFVKTRERGRNIERYAAAVHVQLTILRTIQPGGVCLLPALTIPQGFQTEMRHHWIHGERDRAILLCVRVWCSSSTEHC